MVSNINNGYKKKIGRLEKQQKLYLRVDNMECKSFKRALAVCQIFEGETPFVFYDRSSGKYASSSLCVKLSPLVIDELKAILGDENVIVK